MSSLNVIQNAKENFWALQQESNIQSEYIASALSTQLMIMRETQACSRAHGSKYSWMARLD